MKKSQVIEAIRRSIGVYTASSWADLHGINRTSLSDVLGGRREPTDRMCEVVGIRKSREIVTKYERIK